MVALQERSGGHQMNCVDIAILRLHLSQTIISQHAFGPVILHYFNSVCVLVVNQTLTLLSVCVCCCVFVCVSVCWARSVAPSPPQPASRCWPAGRPDSDPAGWTPESEPSPPETPRSRPPAPPRSPEAPAPAPEGSKVTWSYMVLLKSMLHSEL